MLYYGDWKDRQPYLTQKRPNPRRAPASTFKKNERKAKGREQRGKSGDRRKETSGVHKVKRSTTKKTRPIFQKKFCRKKPGKWAGVPERMAIPGRGGRPAERGRGCYGVALVTGGEGNGKSRVFRKRGSHHSHEKEEGKKSTIPQRARVRLREKRRARKPLHYRKEKN